MVKKINLEYPIDPIIATISRFYEREMTTTFGGNISIIDDEESKFLS